MKHYEKPAMNFVNLRNESAVAETCWGNHGNGFTYYCDLPGVGHCSFQIEAGPCALNLVNVMYITDEGIQAATNEQIVALKEAIEAGNGKGSDNSYKGLGTTVLPTPPAEDQWS